MPRYTLFIILLVLSLESSAQKPTTGNVRDNIDQPIPGAYIVVEGTTNATVSDVNGNFTLENVQDGDVLLISYVGYETYSIAVNSDDHLDIVLQPEFLQYQHRNYQGDLFGGPKSDVLNAPVGVSLRFYTYKIKYKEVYFYSNIEYMTDLVDNNNVKIGLDKMLPFNFPGYLNLSYQGVFYEKARFNNYRLEVSKHWSRHAPRPIGGLDTSFGLGYYNYQSSNQNFSFD